MTTTKKKKKKAEFEYEFGGPVGAFATTVALPVVILWLTHWSHVGQVEFYNSIAEPMARSNGVGDLLPELLCPGCSQEYDYATTLLMCAAGIVLWFLFQVLLERLLPCELVEGTPIPGTKQQRLTYRINGHLAFWVTLLVAIAGWPVWHNEASGGTIQFTAAPVAVLYQYCSELALVTCVMCFALSFYFYASSFFGNKILAVGGDSGNPVYDFFLGRELNPRMFGGSFDWKEFCELRPGLMGWMLLNIANLQQQQSHLGYVTGSMMLVTLFQGIYVWDALYQERAILTTMDITTDGFGFMLLFGDLAWVPFTYSIQTRYLVYHDPHLSWTSLVLILALHCVGYSIFRGANGQKDAFRRNPQDPKLRHLKYLQTKRGTKLLTSGWWGTARKINYTGDWIMGLTWCLVCGVDSIVPYYYAIYFAILLIHRSMRDDHMCRLKYGDDWDTYKQLVPYRFVPGVF